MNWQNVCDEKGRVRFFTEAGEIAQSRLCPEFPKNLSWFT
jgi:hypothetical protein